MAEKGGVGGIHILSLSPFLLLWRRSLPGIVTQSGRVVKALEYSITRTAGVRPEMCQFVLISNTLCGIYHGSILDLSMTTGPRPSAVAVLWVAIWGLGLSL